MQIGSMLKATCVDVCIDDGVYAYHKLYVFLLYK